MDHTLGDVQLHGLAEGKASGDAEGEAECGEPSDDDERRRNRLGVEDGFRLRWGSDVDAHGALVAEERKGGHEHACGKHRGDGREAQDESAERSQSKREKGVENATPQVEPDIGFDPHGASERPADAGEDAGDQKDAHVRRRRPQKDEDRSDRHEEGSRERDGAPSSRRRRMLQGDKRADEHGKAVEQLIDDRERTCIALRVCAEERALHPDARRGKAEERCEKRRRPRRLPCMRPVPRIDIVGHASPSSTHRQIVRFAPVLRPPLHTFSVSFAEIAGYSHL